jgi:hypothetical protein
MANEFQHKSVGSQISQSEFESTDGTGHIFDSQAAGDLAYASSTTVLSRLGIGTAGKVLMVNSGATAPEWQNAITGVTSILNTALVIGRDADNDIDFGTDNTILFRADGADQIKLTNGALLPVTDDDIDLGSSSLQFKDGHFDGTVEADAITVGGTAVLTGGAETAITSILNTSLVVGRDADNDIDFGTDNNIIFRAGAQDQVKLIDGALAPVTDNDVDLGTSSLEFKDAYFDGTVNTDALAMGTNTSGNLLVANGSAFASTAVGDLSEISSVASDDVLLAVDTSGGGLKKITRSTLVSGLATSGAISNVVEDTSPELGGDLDVLTHGIVTGASNRNIALTPHGTGVVRIDGTNGVDIESGAISIKNGGAESYVRFYCESSNAHYTQLQAAPHASYSGNVTVVLPASADTLVGKATTDTLTNKTLTSPKINEDVALTSTATELNLLDGVSGLVQADFTKLAAVDSTATELNIVDGNTTVGTTAVADGDGIVTNDGGTMRQTTVQTFATYFASEITGMSNLTTVGTLSTLTVDNVITNGTTIGHTDDTDLMTLADGVLTVTGNLDVSGSVETPTIDFTDGDNAITIADGGTTTFPQIATFSAGIDNALDEHFDSTPSDETVSGVTATFTAGEALVRGECVYLKASDTKMHKAVAAAGSTTPPCIALAAEDLSADAAGKFLLQGFITDNGSFPTYTVGDEVYTPEAETSSQNVPEATAPDSDGDLVQVLGIATGANTLYFNPSLDVIEHA